MITTITNGLQMETRQRPRTPDLTEIRRYIIKALQTIHTSCAEQDGVIRNPEAVKEIMALRSIATRLHIDISNITIKKV